MHDARRSFRSQYALANAFELLLALLAIISAVAFFVSPSVQRSAVGVALHPFDQVWNAGYGLAGLLIVVGLTTPRPRLELAGLSLLAAAVAINAAAVVSVAGARGLTAVLSYVAIVAACAARAREILRP